MKNLIVHIYCVMVDFVDVQNQINSIIQKTLFELNENTIHPTFSVIYKNSGLVISINNIKDFTESYNVVVNILSKNGWLGSVIKIEFVDLFSDQTTCIIPTASFTELMIPVNKKQLSNCVNFN